MYEFLREYTFSILWGEYLGVGIAGLYGNHVYLFEEPPYCFPQWLHHFTFPPATYDGSSLSTPLPTLVILILAILVSVTGLSHCVDLQGRFAERI